MVEHLQLPEQLLRNGDPVFPVLFFHQLYFALIPIPLTLLLLRKLVEVLLRHRVSPLLVSGLPLDLINQHLHLIGNVRCFLIHVVLQVLSDVFVQLLLLVEDEIAVNIHQFIPQLRQPLPIQLRGCWKKRAIFLFCRLDFVLKNELTTIDQGFEFGSINFVVQFVLLDEFACTVLAEAFKDAILRLLGSACCFA